MTFAQIQNGNPILIEGKVTSGDLTIPYATMLLWTDTERASYGIYPVIDDAIPDGKVSTGSTLEKVGNVVKRHFTTADAPPPPVPHSISDRQFAQVLAMDASSPRTTRSPG